MARKDRRTTAPGKLQVLLEIGDHRAARAEALARLAHPAATEAERAEASAVLASLAPDRAVLVAGLIAVAVAVALTVWTLLAG